MGKRSGKQSNEWLEAKRGCGLSDEDIRMAKELGFKPRSLLRNIPAKSQRWKAPVREWIRELYAKRFGDTRGRGSAGNAIASSNPPTATAASGSALEDMLPQYDTTTGEPYFVRGSDGKVFTLEEAGGYFAEREAGPFADQGTGAELPHGDGRKSIVMRRNVLRPASHSTPAGPSGEAHVDT